MEHKLVVFCNVGWMKNYCGKYENDSAENGGSFIAENDGNGMETNNYLVHNHKCYGYMENHGHRLHLEHLGKEYAKVDKIKGVTVVWVAKKNQGTPCIVGWYENATVYRDWQFYEDDRLNRDTQDYYFEAEAENCFLLPEDKRNFEVPRASIKGKGKGMGQSQVWYAEGQWAQEQFIPKVLKYIEENKQYCQRLLNAFSDAELKNVAEDQGEEVGELIDRVDDAFKESWYCRNYPELFALCNLAIKKEESADTYWVRADLFKEIFYLDEAEADYKKALTYDENNIFIKRQLMHIYYTMKRRQEALRLGDEILQQEEQQRTGAAVDVQKEGVYHILRDMVCLNVDSRNFAEAWRYFNKLENVRFYDYKDEVAEFKKYVLECEG